MNCSGAVSGGAATEAIVAMFTRLGDCLACGLIDVAIVLSEQAAMAPVSPAAMAMRTTKSPARWLRSRKKSTATPFDRCELRPAAGLVRNAPRHRPPQVER